MARVAFEHGSLFVIVSHLVLAGLILTMRVQAKLHHIFLVIFPRYIQNIIYFCTCIYNHT